MKHFSEDIHRSVTTNELSRQAKLVNCDKLDKKMNNHLSRLRLFQDVFMKTFLDGGEFAEITICRIVSNSFLVKIRL